MSLERTLRRAIQRKDDRLEQIVTGKAKVGRTEKPRTAVAGNLPSLPKQVKQMQSKARRMTKHARLVVGLLIRAAGGTAPVVATVELPRLDAYKRRIALFGTTITPAQPQLLGAF